MGPLIGPGHAGIIVDNGTNWFSCHFEADGTRRRGSVLAILDDDETKHGSSLDGLPILSPSVLEEQGQAAILISTLVGEEAVLKRLNAVRRAGWEIKTIYRGSEACGRY